MNHVEYNGEGVIISLTHNEVWHIHNRSGCIGHTNHPLVALDLMKQLNWQIFLHYNWGKNEHGSLAIMCEATKINGAVIAEAVNNAQGAWLN